MFQVGEVVSYGATGICTIEDIRVMSLSRTGTNKQEYYLLRPAASPTCITYVPTANEALTAKMRPVLTQMQIDDLICSVKDEKLEWIEDTRHRADAFGQIIAKGITAELLKLIGCLYVQKQERLREGKKFCTTDEKLLASAERIVGEEFAYSLQISQSEVSAYIADKIK
ncbi:MAG: CarD family transcriptional regulator [Oscillospiraceae bacterium]|nr:CarD family transcriptional regulator [Oscillospiraceae bacterium]